jgi:hypothetical protein
VNGDGYADIIVGAYAWDDGQTNEGGAWVYHGSATGMISAPAWYKDSGHADVWFGYSVGTAGDVNGDGYSDVIVGAPYWTDGQTDEGGAWIYYGSSSGTISAPAWYKQPDHAGAHFGFSVGTAGDVNGDGYSDVIVGSPDYDHPTTDEGLASVYHGSASGVSSTPAWFGQGDFEDAQYGYSVSTAGDVNADGYSDVIVGSPYWSDDANLNEGRAWVYLGSSSGLNSTASWHAESNKFDARMGWSVSTAGDVNGDGYSDVIVGAPYWSNGQSAEGRVWVWHGSASGLHTSAAWAKESDQSGAYYGYSVATAGDVNGDGYADIILGAPSMTGSVTDEGTTRVYCGSATGLLTTYSWKGEGGQGGAWYGISVSTAGDINGDGYAEVLVGAKGYNNGETDEGEVFLYYGNASRGASLRPRQVRYGSSAPIAQLGIPYNAAVFRIYFDTWTPFGRVYLAPYFEVKPLGRGFNNTGNIWWGFWDDPVAGTSLGTALYYPPCVSTHWRIRLLYEPSSNPFMPASRWFTQPWNGWNEADMRPYGGCTFLPVLVDP